jgi:hypothetical protein
MRAVLVVIGVILVAFAVWSRAIPLDVSLWGDEAYTARQYVIHGPERIFLTDSYLPNNHVFFSLVTWATTSVIGTSEWALRMMSFLPALASIGVAADFARRRFDRAVALTTATLLVTSPLHLGLSVQARGYGLGFLAAAGMLWFGARVEESGRVADWVGLGVAASIGIWTLPQLAFVYGGHLLAIFVVRERRWWAVAHGLAVGAGSLLFYRGLVSNIVSQTDRVGSRGGSVVGPLDIVVDPAALIYAGWTRAFGAWPEPLVLGSFVALIAVAIAALALRRRLVELRHLTLPWLVMMAALVVLGSSALDRYISFLVIPISVLVALALVEGLGKLPLSEAAQLAVAVPLAAVLLVGATDSAREWDVPFENYAEAVAVARMQGIDSIYTNRTTGVVGFLWYDEDIVQVEATADACAIPGSFVLLDFPWQPEPEPPPCLVERAGERIVVPQRRQPEDRIVVWVITDE